MYDYYRHSLYIYICHEPKITISVHPRNPIPTRPKGPKGHGATAASPKFMAATLEGLQLHLRIQARSCRSVGAKGRWRKSGSRGFHRSLLEWILTYHYSTPL